MKCCPVVILILAVYGANANFTEDDIRCPPGYDYGGVNQYRGSGTYCDRECNLEGLIDNCPIKTYQPVERLYCNFGYARDYNCICVPLGNCPRCASYYPPKRRN